jgi:hypothetical protein
MRSSQSSLFLEKAILQNGKEENIIKLDPGQESETVTFRIKMTQFSDELTALEKDKVIVVDVLNSKFTYQGNVRISGPEAGVNYGGYFNVNHNAGDRTVTITKANSEKLKAGEYNVDFDVVLRPSTVAPGEVVTNTVNNSTVYIYRDAELTVKKTWLDYENNKDKIVSGATIGLYTERSGGSLIGNTITASGKSSEESGTIKFSADDLNGSGTYWLRETVPDESIYKTAKPIPVEISVKGREVDIVSINGTPVGDGRVGAGTAEFKNEPDDQKGDLLFQSPVPVKVRGVQNFGNSFQGKAQFPVDNDEVQPFQCIRVIQPVACLGNGGGFQQTDGIIVVECAHTHAGLLCDLVYGFHGHPSRCFQYRP